MQKCLLANNVNKCYFNAYELYKYFYYYYYCCTVEADIRKKTYLAVSCKMMSPKYVYSWKNNLQIN